MRIPKARTAVYDALKIGAAQRHVFELQLKTSLDQLRTLYDVTATDDDAAKLQILQSYRAGRDDEQQKMAERAEARNRYASRFWAIFGVPLGKFWPDNLVGFDITRFDEQIVKSGDNCCSAVVQSRFGDEALEIVNALLGK